MISPQSGTPHPTSNGLIPELSPVFSEPRADAEVLKSEDQVHLEMNSLDFVGEPDSQRVSHTGVPKISSPIATPISRKRTSSSVSRPVIPPQQRMLQTTFAITPSTGGFNTPRRNLGKPQVNRQEEITMGIYTATYSGVPVFEMMVNGITVMRRRHDSALNATQILKVAGLDKSKRTKILDREILTGAHEKVQGGYGKYQGTWVQFERGLQLCEQYSVYNLLQPLLGVDQNTLEIENLPTKEQALAALRKRTSQVQLATPSTPSIFTFASPIQTTGNLDTPLSQKAALAQTSLSKPNSFESTPPTSVSSFDVSPYISLDMADSDGTPCKKVKRELSRDTSHVMYSSVFEIDEHSIPTSSKPLKPLEIGTPSAEESRELITQVFVETESSTLVDVLGGAERLQSVDLDIPIDDLQNTALHWASALARISLVKDLIQHGSQILRANGAGESCLIRAVLVTNNSDNSSFPQLLDVLYPAIPLVDKAGRSILHHIALTAGIHGRSDASKYYLSCLLEWIVKRGSKNKASRLSLGRFITELVNARDKNGDTPLNIAARIGNSHISRQLLEVGADASTPNRAGLRPIDFGVRMSEFAIKNQAVSLALSSNLQDIPGTSGYDKTSLDLARSTRIQLLEGVKSLLSEVEASFEFEHNSTHDGIDGLHDELRISTSQLESSRSRIDKLKGFTDCISRDNRRVALLERAIEEEGGKLDEQVILDHDPDRPFIIQSLQKIYDFARDDSTFSNEQIYGILLKELQKDPSHHANLPTKSFLRARIRAYRTNELRLTSLATKLRERFAEMEHKFRRVVAQCASIKEDQVDTLLEDLVRAVESDPRKMDLSRVAGFLRKVDNDAYF